LIEISKFLKPYRSWCRISPSQQS